MAMPSRKGYSQLYIAKTVFTVFNIHTEIMKEFKTIQEAAKFVKLKPVQVYETYIKQSILRDTYIIEEVSITKNAGNAVCLKCNRIFLSPDKKRIRRCARCKTLEGNDFTPLAFKSIYDGRQTLRSENVKVI